MRIAYVAPELVEAKNNVAEFALLIGNEKLLDEGAISNDSDCSAVAAMESVGVDNGAVGKLTEFRLGDWSALRIRATCVTVCESHSGVPENDYENRNAELTAKTHFNPPRAGRRRKIRHALAGCITKQGESRVMCAI
jgi:hypothetical protein